MNIVWIGGTGRCGTTALWEALKEHPDIVATRAESHVFVAPCGALHLMEAALQFDPRQLESAIVGFQRVVDEWAPRISDKYGDITKACGEFVSEMSSGRDAIAATRGLIFGLFEQSIRVSGETGSKAWFCEKTPRNLLAIRSIFKVFPESRFIHIKRDPRGVIESWNRMEWNPCQGDLERTAKHLSDHWYGPWAGLVQWARVQENYLEIKLEDLCEGETRVMSRILQFLGIDGHLPGNRFATNRTNGWLHHPQRATIEKLARPFDALMGYAWDNSELIEQEAS